ncbi:hypothetical protein EV426DRAFT_707575 [Tirmania nivea]|nr:hypothetical protein EV426DRAFT_707575 [Tirmania nivea]
MTVVVCAASSPSAAYTLEAPAALPLGFHIVPSHMSKPPGSVHIPHADGRTADGRTADGGTADGGTADGGTADGGTADGGTADVGKGRKQLSCLIGDFQTLDLPPLLLPTCTL